MTDIRPRRSVLYMPGSNARALDKARTIAADGLIFDLEDAVAPDAKTDARQLIGEAVSTGGYGRRELVIRTNGLDTEWGEDDVAFVADLGADAVLLPKVDSGDDVDAVRDRLRATPAADIPIWIMAETPAGILAMDSIASRAGVTVIVMGTADLAAALRIADAHGPGVDWARGAAVMAARAQGLDIIDGVYTDLGDDTGFEASCRNGRQMGFDGKSLIHPRQVEAANGIFGVPRHDVENSRALLDAWDARPEGSGITVHEGRLVEALHAAQARRTLELAAAIEQLEKGS